MLYRINSICAVDLYEQLGDVEGRAAASGYLAVVRLFQGDATVARQIAVSGLRALRLSLAATSAQPYAEALIGLAHGHLRRCELDLAGARATQALELAREAGYRGFEGWRSASSRRSPPEPTTGRARRGWPWSPRTSCASAGSTWPWPTA